MLSPYDLDMSLRFTWGLWKFHGRECIRKKKCTIIFYTWFWFDNPQYHVLDNLLTATMCRCYNWIWFLFDRFMRAEETKLQRIWLFIDTLNNTRRKVTLHISDTLTKDSEMGEERTLKELGAPKLDNEPLCIVFPTLEKPWKLNLGFLNLLPNSMGTQVRILIYI